MGAIVPQVITEDRAGGALVIDGGLRFDSGKTQYLSRTPGSAGNRKTWTWSGWYKRGKLAPTRPFLFGCDTGTGGNDFFAVEFESSGNKLMIQDYGSGSPAGQALVLTSQVFRDPSAWYHIVIAVDTTQTTNTDRIKVYVNGTRVTAFSQYDTWTQDYQTKFNRASETSIGNLAPSFGSSGPFDGEMSQIYFIDGQALDPSYFGYTDPLTNTWRPKKFKPQATPNNGRTWSNDLTSNVGFYAGEGAIYAFDGDNTTYASVATGGASNYINFSCNIPIVSTLRVKVSTATNYVYINGSGTPAVSGTGYLTVPSPPANLTQLRVYGDTGVGARIYAIEVDGIELLDGDTSNMGANAFYLPFDGNSPIGQDMSGRGNNWTPVNFGGSNTIEKATGALPILNTDGGGKVARVGVRTDSNASSLVLALPLVGIKSDFSNRVNGGTTEKVTSVTTSSFSSVDSIFYGGSLSMGGGYVTVTDSSDFNFGTGSYTVECWVNVTSGGASGSGFVGKWYAGSQGTTNSWLMYRLTTGELNWAVSSNGTSGTSYYGGNIPTNKWVHCAACYDASTTTLRLFIDGVLVKTESSPNTPATVSRNVTIGRWDIGDGTWSGYIQDVRIYKGTAKYTQNFIPASTDPDILPDTPSGVAYSSNVALVPSTDGAVAFDGSGDYLSLADSADWALGSGDFTIEAYVYISATGGAPIIASQYGSSNSFFFSINTNTLYFYYYGGTTGSFNGGTVPTAKWTHVAVTRSGDVFRLFVDGVQTATTTLSGFNFTNSTEPVRIGGDGTYDFNGFISNLHIVNGTALYTSNFTPPTAPITSVANTKLLCCKSQTSATAFDVSPGSITANGNAVASNFNPFTANINTQRGQESGYCTLNPLTTSGGTYSQGNLRFVGPTDYRRSNGTIAVSTGKWYWEVTLANGPYTPRGSSSQWNAFGFGLSSVSHSTTASSLVTDAVVLQDNGYYKNFSGSNTDGGTAFSTGDVLSCAADLDANTFTFSRNNVQIVTGTIGGTVGRELVPIIISYDGQYGTMDCNFGQKPFKFPPPAGFQPLALANTPRPTIVRPDQYVGIVTYIGNGSTQSINVGWKPDLVWVKSRSGSYYHHLADTVRGASKHLWSNDSGAEYNYSPNGISAFNSTGFNLTGEFEGNYSGGSYVAWCWKAGGNSNTYNINDVGYATASAAGLTAGTITPTGASVNTKSGFSIITYTGNNTVGATISHGLGRVPAFAIFKNRGASSDWQVYHQSLGNATSIILQTTAAAGGSSAFNSTSPTSTLFTFGQGTSLNSSGGTHVGYLWAEIPGFSKFGTYSGNGGNVFVWCGFRPKYIMIKYYSGSASGLTGWGIFDATRDTYNPASNYVEANLSDAEATSSFRKVDFLSNGFVLQPSSSSGVSVSGNSYIFAAFAETPSFNLYGGQANAR